MARDNTKKGKRAVRGDKKPIRQNRPNWRKNKKTSKWEKVVLVEKK